MTIFKFHIRFQDNEVTFDTQFLGLNGRIGVTKLIIEWSDYQNECFGHLQYHYNAESKVED